MSFDASIVSVAEIASLQAGYPFRGAIEEAHEGEVLVVQMKDVCPRRPNFDHPCRLNNDQGWKAARSAAVCG
jgi:hypothetical protein